MEYCTAIIQSWLGSAGAGGNGLKAEIKTQYGNNIYSRHAYSTYFRIGTALRILHIKTGKGEHIRKWVIPVES